MKEKITVEGRSMIFNIAFVVLNLIGLAFIVAGYHESAEGNATMYKLIGWILMLLSVGGIIVFKGRLMMSTVSRVLVGGLFIVSGLVKANDPLGFSYKLEEYFEDGALAYRIKELFGWPGFSMEWLIDFALWLSVIICIAEIILGVLIIIGGKVKLVSYLMMFMMIFFTFLTWHTSTCDGNVKFVDHDTYDLSDPADAALSNIKLEEAKLAFDSEKAAKKEKKKFVKEIWVISKSKDEIVIAEMKAPQCVLDCGCFGDAMKGSVGRSLTPKESLWKDLILLYLVLWIFISQWIIKPNTRKQNLILSTASMGVVIFFSWVFGWYFPIFFALVSIIGAIWILRAGGKYFGNYYGSALLVSILCIFMITYVLMYNPIKDYRPYAVGSDLNEKMNDGIEGKYEYFYYLTDLRTKNKKRVPMSSITQDMWDHPEIWKADYDTLDCIVKPKIASISDFHPSIEIADLSKSEKGLKMIKTFMDTTSIKMIKFRDLYDNAEYDLPIAEYNLDEYPTEGYTILDTLIGYPEEITDIDIMGAILKEKRIVIVVSKSLKEGSWSNIRKLKALKSLCDKKNVPFIMVCNASRDEVVNFRKKNNFDIPTFAMDEIELKVISRSNPSVVVIENGVVKGKYPHRLTPSVESFKSNHLK